MIYLYWYQNVFLDSLQLYTGKKIPQLYFVRRSLGFQGTNIWTYEMFAKYK